MVKTRKRDGAKLYMADDGTALIHNPSAEDKGTIYGHLEKLKFFEVPICTG